ncbi:hypothetical protein UPYG_G00021890 [Umbra pygmaea]|uniref:Coagulation factor VII n=1 Tax=Umbra pygmaea TaxID=75934 RepID=A0ABD0XL30_UMBPY
MWLHILCFTLSICCGHSASVFLGRDQAHGLLIRPRRANSGWFEELKKGDLERECLEEKCSKEEVREVFEHEQATEEFWKNYNVIDSCLSAPCQNKGRCSSVSGKMPTYTCLCLQGFSGRNCELVFKAIPDSCLHDNGGCEHFCEEDVGRRNCSCADGYFLGPDRQSCLTKETIACGKVPVLGGRAEDGDNPLSPRSRIVGGTECPKGHCPWQVLLMRNGKGFCGGVLYKPSWILTASHCLEKIKAHELQVVAGEHDTEIKEGTEQTMDVAEVIMHKGYVWQTSDSDIALLRLKKPVIITPFAVPVCLPTRSMAERELWAIHLHTVSGWGRRSENGPTSRILRRLNVPRIRSQECVEKSGVTITSNMFCAGYIEGKQDSCKGDSGGPLVTRYRNTTFLLGIVSWGKGTATMILKTLYALFAVSTVVSASVFLERDNAHVVLVRSKRANTGYFEEMRQGNLERECLEEICNYEEAREVFEDDAQTEKFWLTYKRREPCLHNPCKNNGICDYMNNTYICRCPEGFEGKYCQTVFEDSLKCLYLNGGCEHFCNASGPQQRCSCATGYTLGKDGKKCVAQVQYPCGKIPVEDAGLNQNQPDIRAVGGNHCPKGQCPWQVLLQHKGNSLCGGVIVHPEWVITAAHCVLERDAKDLTVVTGEHNIVVEEGTEQKIPVSMVIPHNLYEPATGDSDITLLRLKVPINLGPNAVPICLPQQNFSRTELAAVRFHTVSGWGRHTTGGNLPQTGVAISSPILRRMAVPLIPNSECSLKTRFNVTQNMLCAGYLGGSQEACRGDDGSPLVTYYGKTHFLLGVVAWGRGCPEKGYYDVYTNVANFLDWAEEVMKMDVINSQVKQLNQPHPTSTLGTKVCDKRQPFLLEMALDDY